jgi:hypothetical protein
MDASEQPILLELFAEWNMLFLLCKSRHGGTYKVLRNLLKNKLVHHDATKCESLVIHPDYCLLALQRQILLLYLFCSVQMMDIGSPILDMTSLPSRLWLIEEFLLQLAVKLVLERSQVFCGILCLARYKGIS